MKESQYCQRCGSKAHRLTSDDCFDCHGKQPGSSRSQARRLIIRFERFKNVVLDYSGIDQIGQGFADEVYRVFQNAHPDCLLITINANEAVRRMIQHVQGRSDGAS